jgi:lysophospholipase L1-like esterase
MRTILFLFLSTVLMAKQIKAQENQVTVVNAGYNGNNTADLLARLDKDVFGKTPELVVMMIGTNDMLNLRNILTLAAYEANYQELITKIKKKSMLILMTIPPIDNPSLTKRIGSDLQGLDPKGRVDAANATADDGVHPTKEGYFIIGTAVYQAITDYMPNVKSIVCFGDSITFGYKMTGQGKVTGDSYPALLNRMLNTTK